MLVLRAARKLMHNARVVFLGQLSARFTIPAYCPLDSLFRHLVVELGHM